MREIIVAGSCVKGNCDCMKYKAANPEIVGYPPYHEGCHCYINDKNVEEYKRGIEKRIKMGRIRDTLIVLVFMVWAIYSILTIQ